MKSAVAIDLGGGSGRVMKVTLSENAFTLESIHRFDNRIIEKDGGLFWDTEYLFSEIEKGLGMIAFEKGDSISLDTWGVDYVLVKKDGMPFSPPHCYRDGRTTGMLSQVLEKVDGGTLYKETGLQFMEINTLFQILSEKSDIRDTTLLFMPDYFLYRLSGVMNSELSIASTSQMLSPLTRDWNLPLLGKLSDNFPRLLPPTKPGTVLGPWKGNRDVSVISSAGHDTEAALAAVPSLPGEDFLFLSSGTWSLFGAELEKPVLSAESAAAGLSNESGAGGRYAYLKNITGLWMVQCLKREWGISYDDMEAEAEKAEPFMAFIDADDPLFSAPGPMEGRIRSYLERTGQKPLGTRGQITRTVFESLALKYRLTRDLIEKTTGKKYSVLHMVGGGVKSPMLSLFAASALGITVTAGPAEATVYGNAMLQFIAKGDIGSLEEGRALISRFLK
jgi:Sugar (pentulose and hexulose) kinases